LTFEKQFANKNQIISKRRRVSDPEVFKFREVKSWIAGPLSEFRVAAFSSAEEARIPKSLGLYFW
jgi:hypothetical protein